MSKVRSVRVDDRKLDELESKGFKFSEVVNTAIDLCISDDFDDYVYQMKMEMLDKKIGKLQKEVSGLEFEIDWKRNMIGELVDSRRELEEEYEESKVTVKLSRYMRRLNNLIIHCRYNEEEIRMCDEDDIVEKIEELNPSFSLPIHIDKLKKLLKY